MNSRERVLMAINHRQPDKVPVDLGATGQTGISASTLYKLRKALNLKDKPITVIEPFQILGNVDEDVRQAIGVDVIGLWDPMSFMGVKNERWKPWKMPDGTPTLMAGGFEYDIDEDGNTLAYPQGDRSCEYSMKLPKGGYFFDSISRVGPMDEDDLNPRRDYKDQFSVYDDETLKYFEAESEKLYEETEYAIIGNFGKGGFGDVATIPGHFLKKVRGIRNIEDWFAAHILYPDYIKEVFEMQSEVAIKNLELYRQAVGDRIQVIQMSGTDFGGQNGELISLELYRKLYKPYQKRLNDWVHKNTKWKTFYHSCGSIVNLIDDMIDAGVDILNPVQCSAAGMDPKMLKDKYGERIVFWGGGVDTQRTLPFGTPEQVEEQVKERLSIFSKGGGFVFNTIHNIVGNTPIANLIMMYQTVKNFNNRH